MQENVFRVLTAIIFFTSVGISIYFRRKADKESGETVSRRADGAAMLAAIRIGGLVLWLSPLVYLLAPAWMAWSRIGLPEWMRWLGAALGILCTGLIYWLFSSLGTGITATSATRKQHTLITHGPYRWVRHPLYTVGASLFAALGLLADNWFIAGLGILTFILMAVRTPKEEANLIEKFGNEYREYMKHTGRFFPKAGL
jgi:protein-S-isoprenylcysteine O-methyltransferase Ste14